MGLIRALIVLAFGFVASVSASAETTKDFLAKCDPLTVACKDSILMVELLAMMDKQKQGSFCVPMDVNENDRMLLAKSITDWLAKHPELANVESTEGIFKAYQSVFPNTQACRDSYVVADPFPATTQEFLAYCANEPKGQKETCYDEIARVDAKALFEDSKEFCSTPDADANGSKAMYYEAMAKRRAKVRQWLTDHPELGPNPRRASIVEAYKALYPYPCTNK